MALRSPANREKATRTKNVDPDVQMKLFAEVKSLIVNETQFMAAEGYYKKEEAQNRRKTAGRLIAEIWRRQGCASAPIPYLALNYYDRFVSRKGIPVVVQNSEENEKLFLFCCFTLASKNIYEKFKLSEFLEICGFKDHEDRVIKMENDIRVGLANTLVTITPLRFTKYFILKVLPASHSEHMPRTRTLVNQLIVKSQADIAMTAIKPSLVAASAVLTISSKVFSQETYNNLRTILLDDELVHNNQDSVLECTQEMEKWTVELNCTPLETDPAMKNSNEAIDEEVNEDPDTDDCDEMMKDFQLRWFGVSNNSAENKPRDDGCLGNLIKACCFGLYEE